MAKSKSKNVKKCTDKNCPIHGSLSVRKKLIQGKVISSKAPKTVTIEWERRVYVPKYERYMKKWSRVKAHKPSCIDLNKGDLVKISSCRPLSKTKKYCVIEKL